MRRCLSRAACCIITALVLLGTIGCGSSEDDVREAWTTYHGAMLEADVATVRSLLAAGIGAELQGPGAPEALEMRAALLPVHPVVVDIEVVGARGVVTIEGAVDGQAMNGWISLSRESGQWKILREEWTVDLSETFPVPDVDLSHVYADGAGATPQRATEIVAHDGAVTALAFTRDGKHLVSIGYDDYRLALWSSDTAELLDDRELDDRPRDLALVGDGGAAYVVDAEGRVTEWRIDAGRFEEPRVLAGRAGRSARIAVDVHGQRAVTTSWDDPAKLWDLTARTYLRALPESDHMRGVAFSPAKRVVACGNIRDHFVVWDLERLSWPIGARKQHRVPKVAPESDVHSIAFSPDGRRLATGHMDSSISLWDMERGRQIHNWFVQDASAMDVEFSPCGTVLATAQQDGRVHLWETETQRDLAQLAAHEGAALCVAFNPADGITLASGGEDGAIRIWN